MTANATVESDFLTWYAPLHERFLRYCDSRTLGWEQAEDLVQDAILSALESWDRLDDKDKLLSYMIGIVNNRLRNQLRSRRVHRRYVEERRRGLLDRLPAQPEIALDLHQLLQAIDRLRPAQREALLLTAVSGFSVREAAEIQGCTEGAVKTRVSRARACLREELTRDEQRLSLQQQLSALSTILL